MESDLRTNEEAMRETERQGCSAPPIATPLEPHLAQIRLAVHFSRWRREEERLGALAADVLLHTQCGYPHVLFTSTETCQAVQEMWRISCGESSTPTARGSETSAAGESSGGVHDASKWVCHHATCSIPVNRDVSGCSGGGGEDPGEGQAARVIKPSDAGSAGHPSQEGRRLEVLCGLPPTQCGQHQGLLARIGVG
ncbi:hypothetical protein NHX12_018742 [Muraenolepis orangiensis]|uniref:Uncharacterized protein n=1 Tax=Muraenolepis orangiensis TaxID=630683 RepID=A0A9Q0IXV0_9TELE|nr:hypothetical protein NHX12_018742 [Muraenolepis orangiensis]